MKKTPILFLIIIAFFLLYFFWPFGKRSFDQDKAFAVEISDGGMIFHITSDQETVAEFLKEKNIGLGEKDYVFPAPDAPG